MQYVLACVCGLAVILSVVFFALRILVGLRDRSYKQAPAQHVYLTSKRNGILSNTWTVGSSLRVPSFHPFGGLDAQLVYIGGHNYQIRQSDIKISGNLILHGKWSPRIISIPEINTHTIHSVGETVEYDPRQLQLPSRTVQVNRLFSSNIETQNLAHIYFHDILSGYLQDQLVILGNQYMQDLTKGHPIDRNKIPKMIGELIREVNQNLLHFGYMLEDRVGYPEVHMTGSAAAIQERAIDIKVNQQVIDAQTGSLPKEHELAILTAQGEMELEVLRSRHRAELLQIETALRLTIQQMEEQNQLKHMAKLRELQDGELNNQIKQISELVGPEQAGEMIKEMHLMMIREQSAARRTDSMMNILAQYNQRPDGSRHDSYYLAQQLLNKLDHD